MILSKENYSKVASIILFFWLQKIVVTNLVEASSFFPNQRSKQNAIT